MAAYLWATLGTMLALDATKSQAATTDPLQAVQGASAFGAYVTFRSPWTPLFSVSDWRLWLAILVGVSALAAMTIYAISQFTHRRQLEEPAGPEPTPSPAG